MENDRTVYRQIVSQNDGLWRRFFGQEKDPGKLASAARVWEKGVEGAEVYGAQEIKGP
jgi:hypothetical protein